MESTNKLPLDITSVKENDIILYVIGGEADNTNIDLVFETISEDIKKVNKVILDLNNLVFCNSKFLGNLFFLWDTLEKKGGKMCIIGCNKHIFETLNVVGIFDVIKLFDTKEEGIDYLTK